MSQPTTAAEDDDRADALGGTCKVAASAPHSRRDATHRRQSCEGEPDAWLEVYAWAEDGLMGISPGDELIVITWLHQGHRDTFRCTREAIRETRSWASSRRAGPIDPTRSAFIRWSSAISTARAYGSDPWRWWTALRLSTSSRHFVSRCLTTCSGCHRMAPPGGALMQKPTIFVGSSTEGLEFARAIRNLLRDDAELTLWNEGFFGVGNVFIDTLDQCGCSLRLRRPGPDTGRPRAEPDVRVVRSSRGSPVRTQVFSWDVLVGLEHFHRPSSRRPHENPERPGRHHDCAVPSGRGRTRATGERLARRATASATSSAIWVCPTSRRRSRSTKFGRVRIRPSRACARCR